MYRYLCLRPSAGSELLHPSAVDRENLRPDSFWVTQHIRVGESEDDPAESGQFAVARQITFTVVGRGVVRCAVEFDGELRLGPATVELDATGRQSDAVLPDAPRQRAVAEHVEHAVGLELALDAVFDEFDRLQECPSAADVGSLGERLAELSSCHQSPTGVVEHQRASLPYW